MLSISNRRPQTRVQTFMEKGNLTQQSMTRFLCQVVATYLPSIEKRRRSRHTFDSQNSDPRLDSYRKSAANQALWKQTSFSLVTYLQYHASNWSEARAVNDSTYAISPYVRYVPRSTANPGSIFWPFINPSNPFRKSLTWWNLFSSIGPPLQRSTPSTVYTSCYARPLSASSFT